MSDELELREHVGDRCGLVATQQQLGEAITRLETLLNEWEPTRDREEEEMLWGQ